MFSKLFISAFAIFAAATPALATTTACCNSVQPAGSSNIASLLGPLVGVVLQGLNVPIGIQCNPITVIGVSGTQCVTDPVQCDNVNSVSLVGINCTPINANV